MRVACKLLAVGFPAGYRVLAVYLISYFCSQEVSDYFSSSFFMVSLLATFSGFAVSSQAYIIERKLHLFNRALLILIFLVLAALPCFMIWDSSLVSFLVVVCAAFGYSLFEVVRSSLTVSGRFLTMVCQGVISISLLLMIVLAFNDSRYLLVSSVFLSLGLVALIVGRQPILGGDTLNKKIFSDVASYSVSNGFSSGVMFLIPMLLISNLEEGSATTLAQLVTLFSVLVFLPRYLSTGFLIELRKRQDWGMVVKFEKTLAFYVVFVSISALFVTYLYNPDVIKFMIFCIAVLLSQIALPHANVHAVLGQGFRILRVNAIATAGLAIAMIFIYGMIGEGEVRALVVMWAYLIYVAIRGQLLRRSCKIVLKNNLSLKEANEG